MARQYKPPFSKVSYNKDYPDGEEPTCDICGRAQDDSPNVFNYGAMSELDWNGETGNHKYCEEKNKGVQYAQNNPSASWNLPK